MKKIFFLISIFFLILPVWSADTYTMRRCVMLPITDSVGGAIGVKVFSELETYMRESNWCSYQSSSDLLGIFSRYKDNLSQHLKTKDVLKVVADKLKVGSIIRINLINEINGVEAQLDVLGDDGETLYFSERSLLIKDNIDIIAQTVRNWLEVYGKIIPYDGKINGILGDQITLDTGKNSTIKIGQEFIVKRYEGVKKHPLLKKVVEWDSKALAVGKVFSMSDNQALGVIKVYKGDTKLQIGDWVRIERQKDDKVLDTLRYADSPKDAIGRLGIASAYLNLVSNSNSSSGTSNHRIGGTLIGVDLRGEAWITRNYLATLEYDKSFGTQKKSSGSFTKSSYDTQNTVFKIGGGYRYLPLGFFYGPQIDGFIGYSSYTFAPEYSQNDSIGAATISGIHLGVGASIPFAREYRGLVKAEILPFPSFSDKDSAYGTASSTSLILFEFGAKYQYTPQMTFDALVDLLSAKANLKGANKSFSAQSTSLKLGASFNF